MTLTFTQDRKFRRKLDFVQSLYCPVAWSNPTVMMGDHLREMTGKKSTEDGEYESNGHVLFLFWLVTNILLVDAVAYVE